MSNITDAEHGAQVRTRLPETEIPGDVRQNYTLAAFFTSAEAGVGPCDWCGSIDGCLENCPDVDGEG